MTDTFRAMCAELVDAILTPNPYNWEDSLHDSANRARALLAQPEPEETGLHYSWELHDAEGDWQAGGSAITLESVRREGNHYLQTYSQDGPHTLIIYQASTIEVVTND